MRRVSCGTGDRKHPGKMTRMREKGRRIRTTKYANDTKEEIFIRVD
jgi:hypothetical protein